ncbi:HEAT repeat domain-containing protein [Streptomyces sp. NPDC056255]|uniref:HEAT repeat domain-containing protein n=1 Tax=Streptomyces sp. NPDC056255 TaxID=3345764 RepID=UPI0035D99ADD
MTVTGQDTGQDTDGARMLQGLGDGSSSVRLRAALEVGTAPDPRYVETLIERCAIEPEFFVRDMLTWALTRHPVSMTLPALVRELRSERAQARSQALHTLSKIGDRQAWPAITRTLLSDPDDEVARSAWRAAVVLVPEGEEPALAVALATQLGRGGRETQLSLSRAMVALGDVILPALHAATTAPDPQAHAQSHAHSQRHAHARPQPPAHARPRAHVHAHALATERLLRDPDTGFEFAIEEAKRVVALGGSGQEGR